MYFNSLSQVNWKSEGKTMPRKARAKKVQVNKNEQHRHMTIHIQL